MKPRVVVAEDETLTRMDIIEMLNEYGYNVVGEAADGLDALKECREKKPDIALLDIKMPLMTGLKVAQMLNEENFEGCIIILTAYNIKEFINEATENSIIGYLTKPIDEDIFISRLEMIYKTHLTMKGLKLEVEKAKNKLNERKLVERAKGILMIKKNLSEEEAYKLMRTLSMEKRMSMLELADIIIASGDILL